MTDTMLHTKAEVLRQSTQVEEGVIDAVVGSTSIIDRMGDVIDQNGWQIDNYVKTNPVILWGHNVREERPPIGKALKVWLEGKQERTRRLMFKVKFDLQDSFAADIFRKVKDGFINTVSVGFLPTEWEDIKPNEGPMAGRRYTKQELLELSFVPVPANPEAVVALRSMNDKRLEPVELKDLYPQVKEEDVKVVVDEESKPNSKEPISEVSEEEAPQKTDEKGDNVQVEKPNEDSPNLTPEPPSESTKPSEKTEEAGVTETETEEKPVEEKPEAPVVEPNKLVEEKPVEGSPVEEKPEEELTATVVSPKSLKSKGVIPFSDFGIAPESEGWDAGGEIASAGVTDLKKMCTWYNSEDKENKSAYKLPHHKQDGNKAVWRGIAASMATLLGAREGVDIPEADKKGVYNHLAKHYEQFGKDVPEYKMVEEQVLSKLGEEIQALTLDREEKHVVRLVKKVIKVQKEQKREAGYTSGQVKKALELLNIALSLYSKDSKDGGDNK